jgi:hypothetical protein
MPPAIAAKAVPSKGMAAKIKPGLDDGVDQQRRKKDEINQLLDAVPEMIAQMHPAPDGNPEQDQGEIGEKRSAVFIAVF